MDNLYFVEAKCEKCDETFYLRYDLAADDCWVLTYGIKNLPQNQKSYVSNNAQLNIKKWRIGPQYKCPWCGSLGYIQCGNCKGLTCYDGRSQYAFCAHCRSTVQIGGTITGDDIQRQNKSIGSGQ